MKKFLSLMLALLLLVGIAPGSALAAPTKMQRDMQSALSQGGHITQIGDLLYYSSNNYINSMTVEGKKKKPLVKAINAEMLTVYGGLLYYSARDPKEEYSYHLYSYKPGAKKSTRVLKNVQNFTIHKGIIYYTQDNPTNVKSHNLKTGKTSALYTPKYGGVFTFYTVQNMIVMRDLAIVSGDDGIVFYNPSNKKTYTIKGTFSKSVQAHGNFIYLLDDKGNLLEYSFDASVPSLKKVRTVRKNVNSFILSGDYFYIAEMDANYDYITVYKRNTKTDKESVFIKKTKRTYGSGGADATLEPMAGRIWRFDDTIDNIMLCASREK